MKVEKKLSCEVICTDNGKDGVEILRRERVNFVLLDIMMLEQDGIETLEKIRKISNPDNEIQNFITDFSRDGLKNFLMNASKEALLQVLPLFPFGGVAKVAFQFIENVIRNM